MEIPIKNAFISKAIKKDKSFCAQFSKSNKYITLSPRHLSFISQIKDLKHNYDYSKINQKEKNKNNSHKSLKNTKNFSDLCLIRNNKKILDNNMTYRLYKHSFVLPKLITSNHKFEDLKNLIKIQINNNSNNINNSNENSFLNGKINSNMGFDPRLGPNHDDIFTNKKNETLNTCRSTILLTRNVDKKDNNSVIHEKIQKIKIKLLQDKNKGNFIKYLNLYNIGRNKEKEKDKDKNNISHKKLLIQLNALNAPALNNCIWKIHNIKQLQTYKNKLENKYLSKKIMIKRMQLENIT